MNNNKDHLVGQLTNVTHARIMYLGHTPHIGLGSHTWIRSSQLDQITHVSLQVNGAKLTLLGGSLNPQGVLEVLLYDFDNRAGLHLNTRLGLTGQ